MEENKKYTATDFSRYHSGMMPADEMHALEKAALADPFLADALDGYAYSMDTQKELAEIKTRLDDKNKRQRIFSIESLSSSTWWQIAAIFLVIAGIGFFFFQKNNHSYKAALAAHEASLQRQKQDSSITMNSTASEESTEVKPETATDKIPLPIDKDIVSRQAEIKGTKNKKNAEELLALNEKTVAASQMTAKRSNEYLRKKTAAPSDSAQAVYSAPMSSAPAVAYSDVHFNDTSHEVALNKNSSSEDKVVVVGYGTKQKSVKANSPDTQLEGKVSGIQISSTPYLLEGKEKFDTYIKEHAIAFPDSVNILLSFKLDRNRKPSRIKVVSSSCKSCEAQAKKLLRNGPAWVGEAGAKGSVRIKF